MPMPSERKHLNSLGFVIGGKQSRALIVWGIDAAGTRIGIEAAERGGSQALRCECGTLLVAKKGDIREHHFAHKAGNIRHCETASAAAVTNFISDTLLDTGQVYLPLVGNVQGRAHVLALSSQSVDGQVVHLVDAQKNRKLAILVQVRRTELEKISAWCRDQEISGMAIELGSYRNQPDEDLQRALILGAHRKWLYRDTSRDLNASPYVLRRIYGLRC